MRKVLVAITIALLVEGMAMAPAGAVQVGDGPNPVSPADALEDLVDGLDTVNSGAGSIDHAGARGTAWTTALGVHISGGDPANPDLDMRVIETLVATTTDHKSIRAPRNFSRGGAKIGSFYVRDILQDHNGGPQTVPTEEMHGESYEGSNSQRYCADPNPSTCADDQPVQLPTASTALQPADVNWEDTNSDVRSTMALVDWAAREANRESGGHLEENDNGEVIVPLPTGSQEIVAGAGAVVDGIVHPASIDTSMTPDGGSARVESSVRRLAMLAGLTEVHNAGPGRQETSVNSREATAETALLSIDRMTVLNSDALFRLLGLDSSQLPTETLAQLAEGLGIHSGRLVGGTAAWAASAPPVVLAQIQVLKSAGSRLTSGSVCDLVIDNAVREAAAAAGIAPPSCLNLAGTLTTFVDAVNGLAQRFHDALVASVGEESVVSITKLNASAAAQAAVIEGSDPEMTSATWGGIEKIIAAGASSKLDLGSTMGDWNSIEEFLNTKLCDFMSILDEEFCNVVQIQVVPTLVEKTETVSRRYARATAQLDMLRVAIDLPGREAVERAAARLLAAAGDADDMVGGEVGGLLPGTGGGGGGGLPGLGLGRAAVDDPIFITVGSLTAQAIHRHPNVELPCDEPDGVCDSSTHRSRAWEPQKGFGGSNTSDTNLPRTGAAGGTMPVFIAAGLGGAAYLLRRWLAETATDNPAGGSPA